jgi:hypothetical protein
MMPMAKRFLMVVIILFDWIDPWVSNNWYRSVVEVLRLHLAQGGDSQLAPWGRRQSLFGGATQKRQWAWNKLSLSLG